MTAWLGVCLTIDLTQIETQFDAGQYKFEIEPATFSMADYDAFVASIQPEIDEFRQRQTEGVVSQEARCVLSCSLTMSPFWIRDRRELGNTSC